MTEQQKHLLQVEELIRGAQKVSADYRDGLYDILYKRRRATRTGCWEWTGAKAREYGQFQYQNKFWLVHRASWVVEHGYIPPRQLHILHHCDNPACFRPDHLFPGDAWINSHDMLDKGRAHHYIFPRGDANPARGENHPQAKLTWEIVGEIRARRAAGEGRKHLAKVYGITSSTVYEIVTGRIWKI